MKKKTVLVLLAMCVAFSAAACGEEKESGTSASEASEAGAAEENTSQEAEAPAAEEESAEADAEESTDTEEADSAGETSAEEVRLVSVDDVSDYVTIGGYKGLELNNVVQPVSDDDIDAEIEYQLMNSSEQVADGTLEEGDIATVNYTATIDGSEFDGGSQENYEFIVGESGEVEDFDNGLLGMAKGETRELTISFPADYYNPNVAGQTAVYEVTLLQFTRTPELTDEWVAANTDVKTVDEYRESVRKQLEDNADLLASYDLYAAAWTEVLDGSEVKEYPKEDLDAAILAYQELNEQYIREAGMDMNEFLESQGISQEEYDEECTRYAEAKVEQNLIVQGIMDAEGLSLADPETQELTGRLVQEYGVADINELTEFYGEQEVNESLALLRVEKFIVDNATVNQMVGGGDDLAVNEDYMDADGAYDTGMEDTSEDYIDEGSGDEMMEEDMVIAD